MFKEKLLATFCLRADKFAGTDFDHVVKATCFLSDINDFVAFNEVYKTAFTEAFPARSAVEVARLPKDVKIEIEVIAEIL